MAEKPELLKISALLLLALLSAPVAAHSQNQPAEKIMATGTTDRQQQEDAGEQPVETITGEAVAPEQEDAALEPAGDPSCGPDGDCLLAPASGVEDLRIGKTSPAANPAPDTQTVKRRWARPSSVD